MIFLADLYGFTQLETGKLLLAILLGGFALIACLFLYVCICKVLGTPKTKRRGAMTTSAQLPLLVMDKSFAHAPDRAQMAELASSYMVVVPDDFVHEVFTTADWKRVKALTGFPDFYRIHVEDYLQRERATGEPVLNAPSEEFVTKYFNPAVTKPDFQLAPEYRAVTDEYQSKVVNPSKEFWTEAIGEQIPGFTGEECLAARKSEENFRAACAAVRQQVRVQAFAKIIRDPLAEKLDARWFIFRKYQTIMLQALVMNFRYPNGESPNLDKLENDVHDMKYLLLALVTQNLATGDDSDKLGKTSLGWRFKTLLPEGNLIVPKRHSKPSYC